MFSSQIHPFPLELQPTQVDRHVRAPGQLAPCLVGGRSPDYPVFHFRPPQRLAAATDSTVRHAEQPRQDCRPLSAEKRVTLGRPGGAARFQPLGRGPRACAGAPADLNAKECYGGLDLSSTTDLSAFVLVFPSEDGSFDVLDFFWVPEEGAKRRERRDRVSYGQWIRDELRSASRPPSSS